MLAKGISGCLQVWRPNVQYAVMHIDIEAGAKLAVAV
jgi:hypothetical protein